MYSAILFLRAHTSVHAGTGATVGAIDLPIQRERHTGWPMIQGSSIKGVLRDHHRRELVASGRYGSQEKADEDEVLMAIYGPPVGLDSDKGHHAGALAVTDARILAFPVRSAKGVFAWVTCPGVIERLMRDLRVVGAQTLLQATSIAVADDTASVAGDAPMRVTIGEQSRIVLEDISLNADGQLESQRTQLAEWLAQNALGGRHNAFDDPRKRLVIVADDVFSHLVRYATEIVQRIALEYETKKVKTGALFSQEFLPPETLMYSVLLAEQPRRSGSSLTAERVVDIVASQCNDKLLQLGGDETTGKGLCWAFVRSAGDLTVQEARDGDN